MQHQVGPYRQAPAMLRAMLVAMALPCSHGFSCCDALSVRTKAGAGCDAEGDSTSCKQSTCTQPYRAFIAFV